MMAKRQSHSHPASAKQQKTWQFWAAFIRISLFQATKTQKRNLIQYCTTIKKLGVDLYDQMATLYSIKAASRRWPVHVFYNVVYMVFINSWILYKQVCQSSISRREFMQRVAEELTGSAPTVTRKRRDEKVCSLNDTNAALLWNAALLAQLQSAEIGPLTCAKNVTNQCVGDVPVKSANCVHKYCHVFEQQWLSLHWLSKTNAYFLTVIALI